MIRQAELLSGDDLNAEVHRVEGLMGLFAPVDYMNNGNFVLNVINREHINVHYLVGVNVWIAATWLSKWIQVEARGNNATEAVLRCYVELADGRNKKA